MTHPIPVGRRVALHDPAFWRPLKGLVSSIAEHFLMDAEAAGTMLYEGMSSGEIGHRNAAPNALDWIVFPRAAELVRLSGLSYDEHINWRDGTLRPPEGKSYPLEVYWPDVERAARTPRGPAIDGKAETVAVAALSATRKKRGPKGGITARAAAAMLANLRRGNTTEGALRGEKQDSLAALYGVASRSTACVAMELALSQFNSDNNSDK